MNWKSFFSKNWFGLSAPLLLVIGVLKNIYLLVITIFVIWMLFFDTNSYLTHHDLNSQIKKLEEEKKYLQKEINKDKVILEELSTKEGLEKFAREKYYMKKEGEEIFIIEYEDSVQVD